MTIDERIEEKGFWYDSSDICCVDYTSVVELIEEQRKIDIDKACKFLLPRLKFMGCSPDGAQEILRQLRQAIEEEL